MKIKTIAMKRIVLIITASFIVPAVLFAQNIDDAFRYSRIFYQGTARFNSMGGAFTALGGDLSTLSQNPAGLGVFRSSEFTVSPQLFHIRSDAAFNGSTTDYLYNFNLGQIGIVSNLVSNSNDNGLVSLNFGYSFNKTNNFHQSIRIDGTSSNGSLADFWALNSDGVLRTDLSGAEQLAYDTWVMDTITGSGERSYGTVFSNYGDNYPSVYGQRVRRLISYDGYTGEHAISIGGNYSNKLFFGATVGISRMKYTSHYEHTESTDRNLPSKFENFTYTDHFENTGTGYSLKIGAIYKPVESLRIGVAFHSPTYFRINEYFNEDMTSNFTDGGHYEFKNDPLRYSYALTTPFRALAGVALQIQKRALISADYEFVDYSTARFSETGDGYDYSEKNMLIKDGLKPTSNFRLGAELRFNTLYLRTGYGYYGKALQSNNDNNNLDYRTLSFGVGFREQNVSVDFGFTNLKYSEIYTMYPSDNSFLAGISNLDNSANMFTITLGYKFGY